MKIEEKNFINNEIIKGETFNRTILTCDDFDIQVEAIGKTKDKSKQYASQKFLKEYYINFDYYSQIVKMIEKKKKRK